MQKRKSSKTTHALERELLPAVMHYLHELGCEHVVSELRFFDRGIDVYGTRGAKSRTTYAVELKLTDWERALQQAAVYQLCSDYSYIALPLSGALNLDLEPFQKAGIGILIVRADGSIGELLPARKSEVARPHYITAMRRLARAEEAYAGV